MNIADLLSTLSFNNVAQISQNPTSVIKTPRQEAYDNLLKAQEQAQNTTGDSWGQAIGNSISGLGKIISSAVIKDPYQKAGATNSLTEGDARQDQMIRDWANQRAKQKQDYIQQAKEQLGLAIEDEDKAYDRAWKGTQFAYQQALDKLAQENNERDFNEGVRRYNQDFDEGVRQFDKNFNLKDKEITERIQIAKDTLNLNKEEFDFKKEQAMSDAVVDGADTEKWGDAQKTLLTIYKDKYDKGKMTEDEYIEAIRSIDAGEVPQVEFKKTGGMTGIIADLSTLPVKAGKELAGTIVTGSSPIKVNNPNIKSIRKK